MLRVHSQNAPFRMNARTLYDFYKTPSNHSEYLFEGPEISALRAQRNVQNQKDVLLKVLQNFYLFFGCFSALGDELDFDSDMVTQDQINDYAEMMSSDLDFDESECLSFVLYLQNNTVFDWSSILRMPKNTEELLTLRREIFNHDKTLWPNLKRLFQQNDRDEFEETLGQITAEYLNQYEEIPDWVPMKKLRKELLSSFYNDERIEWYIENNDVRDYVEQNERENYYERLSYAKNVFEHATGIDFDDMKAFQEHYPAFEDWIDSLAEGDDYFEDIAYSQLLDIKNQDDLYYCFQYGPAMRQRMLLHIGSIYFLTQNNDFHHTFETDLEERPLTQYETEEFLRISNEAGIQPMETATHYLNQLKEKINKYELFTRDTNYYANDPHHLQLKELGIKSFPYSYKFKQRPFPGAGFSTGPTNRPFMISIGAEEIKDINPDLFKEMTLHTVQHDRPLGWVGGFLDIHNKIIYATEIQSDLMQRTGYMKNPKNEQKDKGQQIERLKRELGQLQKSLIAPVSPRQKMQETIRRIEMENQRLPADSEGYQRNEQKIQRLREQINFAPELFDDQRVKNRMQEIDSEIMRLQQVKETPEETEGRAHFRNEHQEFAQYKSRIENMFKDWVPLFFNVLVREAKGHGYEKIRLVTADRLMRLWSAYARPATRALFERIYERMAQKYNAVPVEVDGDIWHEIDLNAPSLRYAEKKMNWFERLTKKSESEWMVQAPSGKFVLR